MKKQLLIAALAALTISTSVFALITNRDGGPTLGQRMGIRSDRERRSVWRDRPAGEYSYERNEEINPDGSRRVETSRTRNEPGYSSEYSYTAQ